MFTKIILCHYWSNENVKWDEWLKYLSDKQVHGVYLYMKQEIEELRIVQREIMSAAKNALLTKKICLKAL